MRNRLYFIIGTVLLISNMSSAMASKEQSECPDRISALAWEGKRVFTREACHHCHQRDFFEQLDYKPTDWMQTVIGTPAGYSPALMPVYPHLFRRELNLHNLYAEGTRRYQDELRDEAYLRNYDGDRSRITEADALLSYLHILSCPERESK